MKHGHERALGALGLYLVTRCACDLGPMHPTSLATALGVALYAIGLSAFDERKLRVVATYAYVLWMYWQTTVVSLAVHAPRWDSQLLALDRWLFGQTPSVACEGFAAPWLTDVMSACYQTYLVYLHLALVQVLRGPGDAAERWAAQVYRAFAVGLFIYTLVPALGPGGAFPWLFAGPLQGGIMTRVNDTICSNGSSVLGTFPSLHVLITLVLLEHDFRHARGRFLALCLPAVGLILSTVYLRYHYGVDLAMGALIWAVLR